MAMLNNQMVIHIRLDFGILASNSIPNPSICVNSHSMSEMGEG